MAIEIVDCPMKNGISNILQWKMAIETVDFPINSMVDLSIAFCKRSPEGISIKSRLNPIKTHWITIKIPLNPIGLN